jgi:hypothetical protein
MLCHYIPGMSLQRIEKVHHLKAFQIYRNDIKLPNCEKLSNELLLQLEGDERC